MARQYKRKPKAEQPLPAVKPITHIETWDEYFILQAQLVALKSKDRSTKVGCVIVGDGNILLSTGYNGFPRGVNDDVDSRHERPDKYSWTEHAERNAVFNAARHGIKLAGSRAYLNFEPNPCADCTRALIQAGIVEIIGPNRSFVGKGTGVHYHINYAEEMLKEAGVKQRVFVVPDEVFNSF